MTLSTFTCPARSREDPRVRAHTYVHDLCIRETDKSVIADRRRHNGKLPRDGGLLVGVDHGLASH